MNQAVILELICQEKRQQFDSLAQERNLLLKNAALAGAGSKRTGFVPVGDN